MAIKLIKAGCTWDQAERLVSSDMVTLLKHQLAGAWREGRQGLKGISWLRLKKCKHLCLRRGWASTAYSIRKVGSIGSKIRQWRRWRGSIGCYLTTTHSQKQVFTKAYYLLPPPLNPQISAQSLRESPVAESLPWTKRLRDQISIKNQSLSHLASGVHYL